MVVFKRKTRMLSFRLSEDEYQFLHQVSLNQGARSVSDYARDVLCRIAGAAARPPVSDGLENRMNQLASDLQALTGEIERLRQMVGRAPAAAE